jgi:hypothetical protein
MHRLDIQFRQRLGQSDLNERRVLERLANDGQVKLLHGLDDVRREPFAVHVVRSVPVVQRLLCRHDAPSAPRGGASHFPALEHIRPFPHDAPVAIGVCEQS